MRLITCPICKRDVLLYEENGKVYPNLSNRIQNHIENHRLSEILALACDDMINQALKFEKEMETVNSSPVTTEVAKHE